MNIKTVEISGVTPVVIGNRGDMLYITDRYWWIRNKGDSSIYASLSDDVTAGADGTAEIPAGEVGMLEIDRLHSCIYLNGSGGAEIRTASEPVCPFKSAAKGGGSSGVVTANGNPVQLDGLQGGVPFNSVTVSGKNLLSYPYRNTTKTINGITFTDNGDGTITANGTATANATFLIDKNFGFEKEGNYFLSGCPSGGGNNSFYINWFQNHTGVTIKNYNDYGSGVKIPYQHIFSENNALAIAIIAGATVENLVFRPQLELGSTPTVYEPPITGRELTVNLNGTDYTITPDSNPYTVPIDIIQQGGINVINVSAGELSVSGVRKNAAIKRIWDDMGMDLLFDGTVTADTNCITDNINGYNFLYFYGNLSSVSGESGNVTGSLVIPKTARAISAGQSLVVTTGTIYITVNIINIESGVITFTVTPSDSREIHEFKVFGIK